MEPVTTFRYSTEAQTILFRQFLLYRVSIIALSIVAGFSYSVVLLGFQVWPMALMGCFVAVMLIFLIRNEKARLRELTAGFNIRLESAQLICNTFDNRPIVVKLSELTTVTKTTAGDLQLATSNLSLTIPGSLERLEELEAKLATFVPITKSIGTPKSHAFIGASTAIVCTGIIVISNNFLVVFGLFVIFSVGLLFLAFRALTRYSDNSRWFLAVGYIISVYLLWQLIKLKHFV